MLWKNWLINRLGSLVIVAGPRQARFFHGPLLYDDGIVLMAPKWSSLVDVWLNRELNLLDKGLKVNARKSKVMVGSSGGKMIVNWKVTWWCLYERNVSKLC